MTSAVQNFATSQVNYWPIVHNIWSNILIFNISSELLNNFPQYLIKYFNIQYHKWIIEQFSTIFDQALLETVSALQMLLNIFIFPQQNLLFRHGVQIKDKQTAPQWHISCNCHLFASLSLKIRYLPCMALYGFVCYSAKSAAGVLGETSNPAMIGCYLKIPKSSKSMQR